MIKFKAPGMIFWRRVWSVENLWLDETGNMLVVGKVKTVLIPEGSVIIARAKAEELLQNIYLGEVK